MNFIFCDYNKNDYWGIIIWRFILVSRGWLMDDRCLWDRLCSDKYCCCLK